MVARSARSLALPLLTERLLIRDLEPRDEDAYAALYANRRVNRFLPFGARDDAGARRQLAVILAGRTRSRRDAWELGVELQVSPGLMGACDLTWHSSREAEIGYLLDPDYWGTGLGIELVHGLLDAAFSQLGVARVLAHVEVSNRRSIALLERTGLAWEATLRRFAQVDSRWWDVHLYSITREQWSEQA